MLAGYINKNYYNNTKKIDIKDTKETKERKENKKIVKKYSSDMRDYFYNLEDTKQKELIEIEKKISIINNNILPLRYQILNADLDIKIKATAIKKIEALSNLEPSTADIMV